VKYQLKAEADQSIAQMTNKITNDMNSAKTTDMTKLDAKLQAAKDFYDDAKNNVGTETGNYSQELVDALKQTIDTASAITNQSPQSDIDSAVKKT